MSLTLLRRLRPSTDGLTPTSRRKPHTSRRQTLALETLEGRLVLSAAAVAPVAPPPAQVGHPAPAAPAINMLPLTINSVSVVNGGLVANGSLGHTTFSVPLTVTTSPVASAAATAAGPTASILSLHLAPINLDLLGLDVTTSDICLNITAQKGGGLLGTLLYDVDNLLSSGTSLGSILGSLSSGQLSKLTGGLTNLLNGALSTVTSSSNISGVTAGTNAAGAATQVLNLTLGPVNLSLLGLNVVLDNCSGGPIHVGITAIPSTSPGGGLLGDLLGGLGGVLGGGNTGLISALESAIAADIKSLI